MKTQKFFNLFADDSLSMPAGSNPDLLDKPETECPPLQKPRGSFRRNRSLVVLAILLTMLTIADCLTAGNAYSASGSSLFISEVVSSNSRSLTDSLGGSPDWIELYNGTDSDINLNGYAIVCSLTDERILLGEVTLPAGGYTIVYAEDEAYDNVPCTGFSLSKGGESLYLLDDSGIVLQQIAVPALPTDISYARGKSQSYGYCLSPTPADANDTEIETLHSLKEQAQDSKLTITEVMPEPQTGDGWVELYNGGEATVDLNLFCLADDAADASPCRLPAAVLAPGAYALIYTGDSSGGLSVPFSFGESDHGTYLYDVTGALYSALTWPVSPGSGVSVVGKDAYTREPTPGAANSGSIFSLSGRAAMDATDPVRLSEVLADNAHSIADTDGEHIAWAEIYNLSDDAVPLSGYYLSDDADDPLKWAFPEMTLEAGGYAVVFLSGEEDGGAALQAFFSLGMDEDALYLTDISTMRTDTLALPASVDDVSVGRSADGSPCYYACPSPRATNAPGYALLADALNSRMQGVYISEVCASSDDGDWIELYNGAGTTVDLTGWHLSDDPDDPFAWCIPMLTIEAHGYVVIKANGAADMAAPFGISIKGETLVLTNASGALVDAMATGVLRTGLTSGRAQGSATLARTFFFGAHARRTQFGTDLHRLRRSAGVFGERAVSYRSVLADDIRPNE